MPIAIQVLEAVWLAGVGLAAAIIVIDILAAGNEKRDQDKSAKRMKFAVFSFIAGACAKAAKYIAQLF